jgi:hypothetical protein
MFLGSSSLRLSSISMSRKISHPSGIAIPGHTLSNNCVVPMATAAPPLIDNKAFVHVEDDSAQSPSVHPQSPDPQRQPMGMTNITVIKAENDGMLNELLQELEEHDVESSEPAESGHAFSEPNA